MATYDFTSISEAQALAFNSATDAVTLPAGATAGTTQLFLSSAQAIVTADGVTVTFGAGFRGQTGAQFADGGRILIGGDGSDVFTGALGGDLVVGGAGADTLRGQAGNDSLSGGLGDDVLEGGRGRDTFHGGAGSDTYSLLPGDGAVTAPDVITDWSVDDRINAGTLGPYQETTASDTGRDHAASLIAAGARFVAVETPAGVYVYIDTAANGGAAEDALLLSGRTLADISADNVGAMSTLPTAPPGVADTPLPTEPPPPPVARTFTGTAGADTIVGGLGDDTIQGLAGDDVISDPGGDDVIDGGAGFDTLDYSAATGPVRVELGTSSFRSNVGGGQGSDIRTGFERAIGSAFDDNLIGGNGADTIQGGAGNDTIQGVLAQDELHGGAGDDKISGGGLLTGGEGSDTLSAGTGHSGATLQGGAGNDRLTGLALSETLMGGEGDDTINGSIGKDDLYGGAGRDHFEFGAGHSGIVDPETIHDWDASDRILIAESTPRLYEESSAESYDAALALANARIATGAVNFMSVQVGADVYVFVDSLNNDGGADDAVRLAGRSRSDISAQNFFRGEEVIADASVPAAPGGPPFGAGASGRIVGNMDTFNLSALLPAVIVAADSTTFQANTAGVSLVVFGHGITYQNDSLIVGGSVTSLSITIGSTSAPTFLIAITHPGFPADPLDTWLATNATQAAFTTIFAGADRINGGGPTDLLRGYDGNDLISGLGGADTIFGGLGSDIIYAGSADTFGAAPAVGGTYLRGDEGDDYIIGGMGFDDINGNQGNDTASGSPGDDWVVGGKDNDLLYGMTGSDLVYGNLGSDTCDGGSGNDIVRGGQNDDIVNGGAGDDFVSGDRGDDTMTGGAGADSFHTFAETGTDRVLDFDASEGDRVQLAPGTQYDVAQVGDDVVISMTGGGRMTLVGVELAGLTAGWIFGA